MAHLRKEAWCVSVRLAILRARRCVKLSRRAIGNLLAAMGVATAWSWWKKWTQLSPTAADEVLPGEPTGSHGVRTASSDIGDAIDAPRGKKEGWELFAQVEAGVEVEHCLGEMPVPMPVHSRGAAELL